MATAPASTLSRASTRPQTPTRHLGASGRREDRIKITLYALAGGFAVVVFVLPLLWALMRSLQPNAVITAAPDPDTFFQLTLDNFRGLATFGNLAQSVGNSLIVALGTALLTMIVATLAGYGFAAFRFRFSSAGFALILITMMIPFQAIITPLFMELNALGLTNSRLGLILFYTTVNLPFGVFVMRTALPRSRVNWRRRPMSTAPACSVRWYRWSGR